MAMKKNLDERARKKAFDEIFDKFDHNKNGKINETEKNPFQINSINALTLKGLKVAKKMTT